MRRLMVVLTLVILMLSVPLSLAQEAGEATTAAVDQAPPSGPLIMLLLGIGAVVVVSGIWLIRERNASAGNVRAYRNEE